MPGDILQAEDRVHRLGQAASSVTIQFLLVKGSVDDIMWDVLQSKLDNVGQLLDGARDKLQVGAGQGGCAALLCCGVCMVQQWCSAS